MKNYHIISLVVSAFHAKLNSHHPVHIFLIMSGIPAEPERRCLMLEKKKSFSVRHMAVTAMLGAISVVLGITQLGFIPIGMLRVTILHIPVIIGAIVEGPIVGALVGLIFGVSSLITAITTPTPVSFVFINPLVSILPRILIGIGSFYVYELSCKLFKNKAASYAITGVLGTMINTAGVLSMIYILYADRFVKAAGLSTESAAKTIAGIAVTNGIPEMIVAAIIVSAVVSGIKKIR